MINDKVSIVCVLKNGGAYSHISVENLKNAINKVLSTPYEFICLTDVMTTSYSKCLLSNYYKWWSKLEAFRITGAVIYFDLDTAIFQSIDSIAKSVLEAKAKSKGLNTMYMLHTFRNSFRDTGEWSSSFMAWSGDWKWLYREFNENEDRDKYQWEQRYIIDKLKMKGSPILSIQGLVEGKVVGYKHYTLSDEEIKNMNITVACFHNKPNYGEREING